MKIYQKKCSNCKEMKFHRVSRISRLRGTKLQCITCEKECSFDKKPERWEVSLS